jgi:Flp pilus assembly protein TadD
MTDSILKVNTEQELVDLIRKTAEGELTLQQFFEFSNEDIDHMALLANALYEEERYDDALVILEGLIALNDKDSRYYNAAGAIFIQQEKYDEAYEALTKSLELDPNNLDAYVNRGEVFLVNSRLEEAAADFEKAISMDPREENPSANRARQLVWGMYQFLQECEKQGLLDPDFDINSLHEEIDDDKPRNLG